MGVLTDRRLLELYPPFFFMGAKVLDVSKDYRWIDVYLPLRWYGRNMHGTMFGGWLSAVSDPLPALLCAKAFPDVVVWTKSHCVDFKRPARSGVHLRVEMNDVLHAQIMKDLETQGRSSPVFEYEIKDRNSRTIARVRNVAFVGLKSAVKKRKLDD